MKRYSLKVDTGPGRADISMVEDPDGKYVLATDALAAQQGQVMVPEEPKARLTGKDLRPYGVIEEPVAGWTDDLKSPAYFLVDGWLDPVTTKSEHEALLSLVRKLKDENKELHNIRELCIKALCRATGESRSVVEDAPLTAAIRAAKRIKQAEHKLAEAEQLARYHADGSVRLTTENEALRQRAGKDSLAEAQKALLYGLKQAASICHKIASKHGNELYGAARLCAEEIENAARKEGK